MNRLVSIYKDPATYSGAPRFDFKYDARGRLRERLQYTWNSGTSAWDLVGDVRYVYDGFLLVQERNSSNAPQVSYTHGIDLSGSFEGAGGIGGYLERLTGYQSSNGTWSTAEYYHADANGNVTALMDSSENLTATYRYDPFGRTITSTGTSAATNTIRFSSKQIHENSAGGV
jgi:hypothetical protein